VKRAIPSLATLPRPVYSRKESLAPGSWTDPHSHPWHQLSYAISGVLSVQTPQGNYIVPPRYAVCIPPRVEHQVFNQGRTEMRSLYLMPAATIFPDTCTVLEVSPLLRELIRKVGELPVEYAADGPAGRVVAVLMDELVASRKASFALPMPKDRRLLTIYAALQANPADNRTLAEWASSAGASERTLSRQFVRDTGMSFGDWRRRLRLMLSVSALESGASVTAVALSHGYESTSAFIAAFRDSFGFTPGELREP
jgi:AraC-like DNA-binding protein